MDLDRERRLNRLLARALERSPGERRPFLETACGDDTALLEEALAYLGREERIGDFLERPALAGPGGGLDIVARSTAAEVVGPGGRVGRYRILEPLGTGGMGEVFRAEDTHLGRVVALKFLRRELTGHREAKARFLREASAVARLDHPNVCTVHEIGETEDGQLYIVMACYEGESLRERIERGPLPVDEAVRIARQVAAGLARAHREGIVHRDVKPANIFLTGATPAGTVKVLDFGVAKVRDDAALTGTGRLVGTPYYMAPEQLEGVSDHRSDIWALGVVLYEMLTGERPFPGPRVMEAVIREDSAPSLIGRRGVPEAVARVVVRALAKRPGERYRSVEELAADLPIAGTGLPSPTPRRRRVPRLPAAALVTLALVLGGLYGYQGPPVASSDVVSRPAPGDRDAKVVAILPFEVEGGTHYGYLGAGMVDLLSTKLDDAAGLRVVDSRLLLRRFEARPVDVDELTASAGFARELAADLLVVGRIVEVEGTGELRMDAALHGAAGGGTEIARATASGEVSEIFSMVDVLAARLLTGLDRGAAARMGRLAARTTQSFPALKSYLEGEASWRGGRFAEAATAFEAAVAVDPGFALAWYRLSSVRNWLLDPSGAAVALARAVAHGQRLGPDDRRVLAAVDAYNRGAAATAERLCRDVLSRRPDDLEAWKALGEIGFHLAPLFGRSLRHSRAAWERAVELEPDDRQAHLHLARLDLYQGRHGELVRRSRLLRGLLAGSERSAEPVILLGMMPGYEAERRQALGGLLSSELGISWLTAGFTLASGPEARAFWSSFFEALLPSGRSRREQAFAHRHLGILALAAGRLEAADRHLAAARTLLTDQGYGALAATLSFLPVSGERLRGHIAEVEAWPTAAAESFTPFEPHTHVAPYHRLYVLALLASRAGDPARAGALADELAGLGEVAGAPGLVRDLELGIRADVAWRSGRHRQVVELLAERHGRYGYEISLMSPLFSQSRERYLKAESLYRLGRLEEAVDWYETLPEAAAFDVVYLGLSYQRRAEIQRRLGRVDLAGEHERRLAELWRSAEVEARRAVQATAS